MDDLARQNFAFALKNTIFAKVDEPYVGSKNN